MKYFLFIFLNFSFLSGWTQTKDNSFPLFADCENTTSQELKPCFYKTLEDFIVDNFRWSQIEGEYQDSFTLNFLVSEKGSFKLMEFEENVTELRFEFYYIFSLLPPVTPVKIDNEDQITHYQLSFDLISSEEKIQNLNFEEVDNEDPVLSFAGVEKVPVFPGCEYETDNVALKQCMSRKVGQHINQRFNVKLAKILGLEGVQRILVQFKIDHLGFVTDVRVGGPHPRLEEEARLIVMSLPKMIPGEQEGKPVSVLYSIPIVFEIVDD